MSKPINTEAEFCVLYANTLLRNNPDNLKVIGSFIRKKFDLGNKGTLFDLIINEVITYAKSDPEEIIKYYQGYKGEAGFHAKIAFEAIYGWVSNGCNKCSLNNPELRYITYSTSTNSELRFISDPHSKFRIDTTGQYPKCYECEQIAFISLMAGIEAGHDYSIVESVLKDYIDARKKFMNDIEVKSITDSSGKILSSRFVVHPGLSFSKYLNPPKADSFAFHQIIRACAGYSLIEMIKESPKKKNNRKKIKRCIGRVNNTICGKFFIASKAADHFKYCDLHRLKDNRSKKTKSEAQKERRNLIKNKDREKKIKEFQRIHDCSREDAISLLDIE